MSEKTNYPQRGNLYFSAGIVCTITLACIGASLSFIRYIPKAVIGWDEASNMLWGYKMYSALKAYDWQGVISLSNQQVYYPPLQSWFIGLTSLFTGFSPELVRITNLLWIFPASVMIFLLGTHFMNKRQGVFIGLLAVIFYILSPMTLMFSSIAMKENMGVALTLFSFAGYVYAEESARKRDYLIASFLWLLLLLFKYNYALILLAGYGAVSFVNIMLKKYKSCSSSLIFWLLNLGWIFLLVLAHGKRLLSDYVYAQTPATVGIGTLSDKILFYPRSIAYLYGFSIWIGLFFILAVLVSVIRLKNNYFRALWIITVIHISIMALYVNNLHDRFIYTVAPFIYLISARVIPELFTYILKIKIKTFRYVFAGLISFFIFISFSSLPRLPNYVYAAGAFTLRSPIFNQLDYKDTYFDYDSGHWPKKLPGAGNESPNDVIASVVGTIDPRKQTEIIGTSNELSPKYWELMLRLAADREVSVPRFPYSRYAVTVEVLPKSRFYDRDFITYNKANLKFIDSIANDIRYKRIHRKLFRDLGVDVNIYGDTLSGY